MKKNLEQQNSSFSEFNIVIETWTEIREDIILPLRIDIADIKFEDTYNIYHKAEKIEEGLEVDIRPNPFSEALIRNKIKYEMIRILKFIDSKNKLYPELDKNDIPTGKYLTLFEELEINSYEELYDYFINNNFTDEDFDKLRNVITSYKDEAMEIFKDRAFKFLKINTKPKTSTPISGIKLSEYDTEQTQSFIKLQAITEYHASMPYFKENIGKSLDEISWRELQLRMLFLHRKNQIDSELKRIENSALKTPTEQPKKIVTR